MVIHKIIFYAFSVNINLYFSNGEKWVSLFISFFLLLIVSKTTKQSYKYQMCE